MNNIIRDAYIHSAYKVSLFWLCIYLSRSWVDYLFGPNGPTLKQRSRDRRQRTKRAARSRELYIQTTPQIVYLNDAYKTTVQHNNKKSRSKHTVVLQRRARFSMRGRPVSHGH